MKLFRGSKIDFPYTPPVPDEVWPSSAPTPPPEETVYYWWWAYLKRHEGYISTCDASGQGECSALYAHFGDVRGDDFWDWWRSEAPSDDGRTDRGLVRMEELADGKLDFEVGRKPETMWRGVYLFAEPRRRFVNMYMLRSPPSEELFSNPEIKVLVVPLDRPDSELIDHFKRQLAAGRAKLARLRGEDAPSSDRRGDRAARSSKARFPVVGQPNVHALKKTLMAYNMKKAGGMTLWQIGFAVDGSYDTSCVSDRNALSVIASRHIKKATAMIKNAGLGRFPDLS